MDPVIIALIVLVLVIVILGILIFQSNSRSSIDKDFIDNLPEDLKLMLNENKTQTSEKVETLLQPIREALEKNEKQMMDMAKERSEDYGSMKKHLDDVAEATASLSRAMRKPDVRGQWGEMQLKRLAELSGMTEHIDFDTQASVRDENNLYRPDMIVHMSEGNIIIVDAKTPIDAYLDAENAKNDGERQRCLERHASQVKKRGNELSSKKYWLQFKQTPEYVVMFLPGEHLYAAALMHDPSLYDDLLGNKVMLTGPGNFIALLKTIGYGFRQIEVAKNSEIIREAGEKLMSGIAVFSGHMESLRKNLDNSVRDFNKTVGSLKGNIFPTTQKFKELGVSEREVIKKIEKIEKSTRELNLKK